MRLQGTTDRADTNVSNGVNTEERASEAAIRSWAVGGREEKTPKVAVVGIV